MWNDPNELDTITIRGFGAFCSSGRKACVTHYDELFGPIRAARLKASGNQLGNPVKAGEALVHITSVDKPPAHLLLGSDALRLVTAARAAVDEDIRAWEWLSRTTDFPQGAAL